jgi:NAD(P)-dependent dehydrogenase (short-subunit alcohol dehydrogenase family)
MTPVVESARPMRLQGRVAVVTGGGRGIGLGCARAFASEGARVFIAEIDPDLGRQAESVLREGGADATAVPCDVGDPDQVAEMVRSIVARTGRIDICLNNAGISRRNHVFDVTEAEFEAIMRVNLRGVFLVSQAVARAMVAAGSGGSIINMGSIVGVLAVPQQPVYCVTKQGVDGLTRVFSLALADRGIRVNAIAPGTIHTEMSEQVHEYSEDWHRRVRARTPLGRLGTPEDVARTAVFLASDESDYITGETIRVDGGRFPLNHVMPVDGLRY